MKDFGELKYFLGIEFARSKQGILMHQRKYALELISETGPGAAKPAITPLDYNVKLTTKEYDDCVKTTKSDTITYDKVMEDHTPYQRLIAALRIVRYLKKQPGQGVQLSSNINNTVMGFCDVDWASCPHTRKFVIGYMIKLGDSLVSWKYKKQTTISRSSAETEYRSIVATVAELIWMIGLLK
uniref:Uncharacterized mitochondrial protein AtMg00810-like n=1 Tax=Nicotiana tabacum TaxID=4097 RepID=A0A1S4D471_TOBAC|nr:PREDICTED: uncharacterized mitochondrial protein AtMg00810-like [Nicotiana tabacum]